MHSTDAIARRNCNPHISEFAPVETPRILDEPIFTTSLLTLLRLFTPVANNQDCVVQLVIAGHTVKDARLVVLEGVIVGAESRGDGLVTDGNFELLRVACLAGRVIFDLNPRCFLGIVVALP